MASNDLRVFQLSTETVWGTSTSATGARALLAGLTDAKWQIVDTPKAADQLGTLSPSAVVRQVAQHAEGSFESYTTYEDILWALTMAFGDNATTSTQTGSTGMPIVWIYQAPVLSKPTPNYVACEYGTTDAPYLIDGVLLTKLNFKGEASDYWKTSADLLGKSVINSTLSTAPTVRTLTPVTMMETSLYIDPLTTSTAAGLTAVSASLISFDLGIETGRHIKYFAGSVNPANWGDAKWKGSLGLVLEVNSTSKAYVTSLLSTSDGTVKKLIRLKATQLTTSTGPQTVTLDYAGVLTGGVSLFDDRDGNQTYSLKFDPIYSTLMATWLKVTVENNCTRPPSS